MINIYTQMTPNADGSYNSLYPNGDKPFDTIGAYYKPTQLQFISWDFPNVAHTGIDIDYKMTGYDWYNRTLGWTVDSGPAGMTIDADGTLHWTPSTDSTTETVTVGLSFDGSNKITKTFTITIENSRCLFIATTGNDTTGDGSLANPYATFDKVAEIIKTPSTGWTVYHRAGTYVKADFSWDAGDLASIRDKSWILTDPVCIRSYPSEDVTYSVTAGSGFRMYGEGVITTGFEISGGDQSEAGGLIVGKNSIAKQMVVHGYDCDTGGNPTGIRHTGGSILDSCTAYDCGDSTSPSILHNQSTYLYYGDTGAGIESFVIDCISENKDAGKSVLGFKIKHAGLDQIHYHNCVGLETADAFSGIQNQGSVRFSMFHSASGKAANFGQTDQDAGDGRQTNGGMLLQNSILVSSNTAGGAMGISHWAFLDTMDTTPFKSVGNTIEAHGADNGEVFICGQYSGNVLPVDWNIDFSENSVYAANESNCCIIDQGTVRNLAYLFGYGEDNTTATSQVHTKTVNGRTFEITNGVISEVA